MSLFIFPYLLFFFVTWFEAGAGALNTSFYDPTNSDNFASALMTFFSGTLPYNSSASSNSSEEFNSTLQALPRNITVVTDLTELGIAREFNITIAPFDVYTMNLTVHNETAFILVQSHSHTKYLEMNYGNYSVKGTNIGLIFFPENNFITFTIRNFNKMSVQAWAIITLYDMYAPVPGAYVSSDKIITPTPELHVYQNIIKLSATLAVLVNTDNETSKDVINYRLFYKYSPERDLSLESYFEGIRSMKSLNDMKVNATEYKLPFLNNNVNQSISVSFANYPGIGIIFGLVAETKNASSVYVLTHTYGCNLPELPDNNFFIANGFQRVEIMVICVAGVILSFCGHDWKTAEFTVTTCLLFGVIIYTAIYNVYFFDDNVTASTVASVVIGLIFVVIVTLTKAGPVRHSVVFITFGMLVSSLVMFFGVGNLAFMKSEEVYWSVFAFIAVTIWIVLYFHRYGGHFLTSGFIGSFLFVITIDYFSGCSLKYIIFDNVRRINVEDFFESNINPPFQTPDVVLTVLWVCIGIGGIIYQFSSQFLSFMRFIEEVYDDLSEEFELADAEFELGLESDPEPSSPSPTPAPESVNDPNEIEPYNHDDACEDYNRKYSACKEIAVIYHAGPDPTILLRARADEADGAL